MLHAYTTRMSVGNVDLHLAGSEGNQLWLDPEHVRTYFLRDKMREEERIPVPDWLRSPEFVSFSYLYSTYITTYQEVTVSMHHCTDSLMVLVLSVECEERTTWAVFGSH